MGSCCNSTETRRRIRAPLLRRDSIGPTYHVLTFETEEPLVASPGQFAMVRGADWGDCPLLPRPMSLLEAGHRPAILVKVVGEGTRRLAHASPGEPFHLLAPLGNRFSSCPAGTTPILVAGGVGVAPLLFFGRELAASGNGPLALYGARTAADLPLDDDLAKVAEVMVSTEDGSRGTQGRVTELLETALTAQTGPAKVYVCGPDRMMAAASAICEKHNVPCEVSLEAPMACGFGVCLGCAVHKSSGGYLYACVEGPCVDAKNVDWERNKGSR